MKVMWFSRHTMTSAQKADLENIYDAETIEIVHIDKTINSAFELKETVEECDVLAVVLPIHLQEQLLRFSGDKPVLICRSHRVPLENGAYRFVHAGWDELKKIEVIKNKLTDHPAPPESFRK